MSTEMTSDDFFKAVKGPFGMVWKLGKLAYKGAEAANTASKEREQKANVAAQKHKKIEKYKSELREIGLSDVYSVKNALRQGNISFVEYKEIMDILES
jgi:uncharacterized protein YqfA (UPF0365 family)